MGIEDIRRLKEDAGKPKPVKKYILPKKSAKKIAQDKLEKEIVFVKPKKAGWFDIGEVERGITITDVSKPKKNADLQQWFEDRHKELTGKCKHCNGKTQKGKDNYKNSIGHILPKAYFPSVATHPLNYIELCFYGNSCHTNLDNKILDLLDLNCFDEVITKFVQIYPHIDKQEKRRIPQVLLNYIENEI